MYFTYSYIFINFELLQSRVGMERRILITGITLAVSIIIIILVFFFQSGSKENINPIKIIPQDASILLKINDFDLPKRLLSNKYKIWEEARGLPVIEKLNHQIKTTDSLLNKIPNLFNSSSEINCYISGHISGGKKIYFLAILNLSNDIKEKDIQSILKNPAVRLNSDIGTRKYEGRTIFTVTNKNADNSFYFTVINGMLAYSRSPVLVEDAIRQSALSKSLLDQTQFKKIVQSIGKNKDANLFVNLSQTEDFVSLMGSNKLKQRKTKPILLGDWVELDINIKDDLILLNGFALETDSSASFVSLLTKFDPVKIEVDKILPSSISSFISFGISSPSGTYKAYKEFMNEKDMLATYEANLKNMNSKYGVNFDKFFLELLSTELTLAYKEPSGNMPDAYYLIFKCKSGTEASKAIQDLSNKLRNKFKGQNIYNFNLDNEITYKIYNFPIYPLFGRLIGNMYDVFEDNYMVVYDNYLIISNSYKNLTRFLYENMLQKTLNNDEIYQKFSSCLSMKSQMVIYSNLSKSIPFLENYLSEDIISNWKTNLKVFQKIQTAGIQLSEVSNLPYFNIVLNYQDDFRGQPKTVWESLLDTTIHFKPKFVINHYTKQSEIIIQDDANSLYLINQSGRILWKIPLEEPINSDIFQIDFYKNGKLQLMFSTEHAIHLIDRNGNYIERYPVKLRSKSTAGMALFDYEDNKNYRVFIPCEDKNVYVYNKEGSIINGWMFKGTDYTVKQPVEHFRVGQKDYVVISDKNYTYILDRKGNERVKITETISNSANNTYYLQDNEIPEQSYIVSTNEKGTIVKIYFSGKITRTTIREFTSEHYFDYKDIDADGKSDYIFLDENTLYVYNSNKIKLFERKFKSEITLPPVYYYFAHNDRKIGLVSQKDQQIYLLNSNGELYKGFPLEGTTQFSIGYFDITSSRFNLIVGGRNNFLYNYTVE